MERKMYFWWSGLPFNICFVCVTGWKEEQEREYASFVAVVLAICFLRDSGKPLFRNSLRALDCSSSGEFVELSWLLSSKMEITTDAFRALFSWPREEALDPDSKEFQQR